MHQSQQAKEPFLLEDIVMVMSLQLHATTAKDGADWMTCNQLDDITAQSSMVIKFTSLEDIMNSESEIRSFFKVLYHFKVILKFGVTMAIQKASRWLIQN